MAQYDSFLKDLAQKWGIKFSDLNPSQTDYANKAIENIVSSSNTNSSSSSSSDDTKRSLSQTIGKINEAVTALDGANSTTISWNQNILSLGESFTKIFESRNFLDAMVNGANFIKPFNDLDQALRNQVNVNLGITGGLSRDIRNTIIQTAKETTNFGIEITEVADVYLGFIKELGRAVPLNEKLIADTAKVARASGLEMREAATFLGSLEKLGINLTKGPEILGEMAKTARSMGLNTSAFMGYATENLKLINTLGFDKGVRGFTEIAAKAASIRFDLSTAASKANELFEVDNAIELAAQLNVLGGEFGRLGNAIDLMFMPTNDFEGFTEAIMEAQKQFVSFNEETQSFEPTPLDLRRAREFAKAMGKDVNTVIEEAKSAARRDLIKDRISIIPGMDDKDRELIASLGQINENGEVTIKGKTITEMSSQELQTELGRLRQDSRKGAMSTDEILNEQMNMATKSNFYLKAIAIRLGAFDSQGGLFSLLGDDLNDLIYSLADGDESEAMRLRNKVETEGMSALGNMEMTSDQATLFDRLSTSVMDLGKEAINTANSFLPSQLKIGNPFSDMSGAALDGMKGAFTPTVSNNNNVTVNIDGVEQAFSFSREEVKVLKRMANGINVEVQNNGEVNSSNYA